MSILIKQLNLPFSQWRLRICGYFTVNVLLEIVKHIYINDMLCHNYNTLDKYIQCKRQYGRYSTAGVGRLNARDFWHGSLQIFGLFYQISIFHFTFEIQYLQILGDWALCEKKQKGKWLFSDTYQLHISTPILSQIRGEYHFSTLPIHKILTWNECKYSLKVGILNYT